MTRHLSIGALALALAAAAAPASVAEAQTVHVGRVRGPQGRTMARRLEQGLEGAGFTLTDSADIEINGRVRRQGRQIVFALDIVRDGETGRVRHTGRRPAEVVQAAVEEIRALFPADGGGGASSSEDPPDEPDEPAPAAAASTAPAPAASSAPAPAPGGSNPLDGARDALEVWVGGGVVGRAQSFRGDLLDTVGSYRLDAAPILNARFRWFPLWHLTNSPLLGIGVQGSAFGAIGLSSERATNDTPESLGTTLTEVTFGLVYKLPIIELLTLEASLDYAQSTFRVDSVGARRIDEDGGQLDTRGEAIPDVVYDQLRPRLAVELNLPLGFGARVDAAYLAVLSAGRLDDADWFPRSSTGGVEIGAAFSWRFDRWFAARLYFAHARYISSLSPEPGDDRVAGGALDEWTRGGIELAFIVPGTP